MPIKCMSKRKLSTGSRFEVGYYRSKKVAIDGHIDMLPFRIQRQGLESLIPSVTSTTMQTSHHSPLPPRQRVVQAPFSVEVPFDQAGKSS